MSEWLLAQQGFLQRLAQGLVRDEASALDLVQETNALALRKPGIQGRGWLVTAMRRLALSGFRSDSRRSFRESRGARRERVDSHVSEVDRRLDLQALLTDKLRALPPGQRQALTLRYGEDLSPRAIAAQIGEPEATVKARLRRGLARLRSEMDQEHQGQRQAWALALVAPAFRQAPAAVSGLAVAGWAALALGVSAGLWLTLRSPGNPALPHLSPEPSPLSFGRPRQPAVLSPRARAQRSLMEAPAEAGGALAPADKTSADSRERPFLGMVFDAEVAGESYLDLSFEGTAGTPIAGRFWLQADGYPKREVELRGRSFDSKRVIGMRVPPQVQLRISAGLDGLQLQPVTLRTPPEGRWAQVPLLVTPRENSAQLVLLLEGEHGLEGRNMIIEIERHDGRDMQMGLRSPRVQEGQLDVGFLRPGRVSLQCKELDKVNYCKTESLVFDLSVLLMPGERAVVPVRPSPSGTLRVRVRGSQGKHLEAKVEIEREGGVRHSVDFRQPEGWRPKTLADEGTLVVPLLAPGRAVLHYTCEGYAPQAVEVLVRPAEVTEVVLQLP